MATISVTVKYGEASVSHDVYESDWTPEMVADLSRRAGDVLVSTLAGMAVLDESLRESRDAG